MLQQQETVERILAHLCEKGIVGDVTEWCEMRHDCVIVVTCPDCRDEYTIEEDEFDMLVRLSQERGFSCGVRPII